jgi:ornithine cyclodeaminase/alanine dehydrogenase-like protein (mu-crystallin family)
MPELRVFSRDDIKKAVQMPKAIELMRSAFAELSSGEAFVPQRIVMEMESEKSRAIIMPAYSSKRKRYSTKIVTLSGNNAARDLPFIHGLLILCDSDSGIPLALMDAEYVTALRTGAASGLATDLLAREDSHVGMIFGSGAQARTQLEGIASVRKLDRVFVYSPEKSEAERFCAEMSSLLGLKVASAKSPSNVSEADIVCTATTSERPVFNHEDLKVGVHINGIGSYKPNLRELDSETIKNSKLVVDSRNAALSEAGDIIIPINEGIISDGHIHAELGEIVLGSKPGRTRSDEITVFKSVGNAVQDLAIASYVLDVGKRSGIGSNAKI